MTGRSGARLRRRALAAAAVAATFATLLVAARAQVDRYVLRTWYGETVTKSLGDAPPGGPARPRVTCAALAVLVLDDHVVARRVADALAEDLAERAGVPVPVHDVSSAPFTGGAAPVDVLALVDRVHLEAVDALVVQRCQVRLNVSLGRPPRAAAEGRVLTRDADGGLGPDAPFALEYSVDGHWQLFGLAGPEAPSEAAAASIRRGLAPLLDAVEWCVAPDAGAATSVAAPASPPHAPAGEAQHVYDVLRRDGARESLLQVTTVGDWRAALTDAVTRARSDGFVPVALLERVPPALDAAVLQRGSERLEYAIAYMQDSVRDAREQRQMLTVLHRVAPAR